MSNQKPLSAMIDPEIDRILRDLAKKARLPRARIVDAALRIGLGLAPPEALPGAIPVEKTRQHDARTLPGSQPTTVPA